MLHLVARWTYCASLRVLCDSRIAFKVAAPRECLLFNAGCAVFRRSRSGCVILHL